MVETSFPDTLKAILLEISEEIRTELDPELILMAGSFGKGSWLYSKNMDLLSDIEIVFLRDRSWNKTDKERVVENLNEKYPYKIELKGFLLKKVKNKILTNYSLRNPGYLTLNFFDVFSDPEILFSRSALNLDLRSDQIPAWEAWRLFINRLAEHLEADTFSNYEMRSYGWMKIFESIGDAYCIVHGIYDKSIEKRHDLFTQELLERDEQLSKSCKNSWEIVHSAYSARRNHDLDTFQIDVSEGALNKYLLDWKDYLEGLLAKSEGINIDETLEFYSSYLANSELQNKYLDFSDGFNIPLSNSLKFILNRKKLGKPFRKKIVGFSWRHLILLAISSFFYEQQKREGYEITRSILGEFLDREFVADLHRDEIREQVLKYWKIIR